MLMKVANQLPAVGSAVGFVKTANKVYNATTPMGAVCAGVKGIFIDCVPPNIKYPVLCAALATSGAACVVTGGNPLAVSMTMNCGRLIMEV